MNQLNNLLLTVVLAAVLGTLIGQAAGEFGYWVYTDYQERAIEKASKIERNRAAEIERNQAAFEEVKQEIFRAEREKHCGPKLTYRENGYEYEFLFGERMPRPGVDKETSDLYCGKGAWEASLQGAI